MDFGRILSKVTCPKHTDIVVITETHDTDSATAVRSQLTYPAYAGVFYFGLEGKTAQDGWQYEAFGLDDEVPYMLSWVEDARYAFSGLLNKSGGYKNISETERSKYPPKIVRAIYPFAPLMRKRKVDSSQFAAMWQVLQTLDEKKWELSDIEMSRAVLAVSRMYSLAQWNAFVTEWSRLLKIELLPSYNGFFTKENFGKVKGSGRSAVFVKNTLAKYCEAAMKDKKIYLQIGGGHTREVYALLRQYLPEGTNITVKSSDEMMPQYQGLDKRIRESGFYEKYFELVGVEATPNLEIPSIVSFGFAPGRYDNKKQELKRFAQLAGFQVSLVATSITLSELPK